MPRVHIFKNNVLMKVDLLDFVNLCAGLSFICFLEIGELIWIFNPLQESVNVSQMR